MQSKLSIAVIFAATMAVAGLLTFDLSAIRGFEKEYRLRLWEKCRFDGDCAYIGGDYQNARLKYQEAVDHAAHLEKNSFRQGVSLANLASACAGGGDLAGAQAHYRQALNALERVNYPPGAAVERQLLAEDLIFTLNRLGEVLIKLNASGTTVAFFNRSLSMAEALSASNKASRDDRTISKEMVEALTGLGTANFEVRKFRDARILYERALALANSTIVPESLARKVRVNLAVTLQETGDGRNLTGIIDSRAWQEATHNAEQAAAVGDYKRAENQYRIAVNALKKAGPEDIRTSETIDRLAEACYMNGHYDDAIELYKRALKVSSRFTRSYEKRDDIISRKLVSALFARCSYVDLESVLKDQLAKRQREFGISHSRCAEILGNLCLVYLRTGRPELAREIAPIAIEGLKNYKQPKVRHARALRDLSTFMSAEGNYEKSVELLETSKEILMVKPIEPRILNTRICDIDIAKNQRAMGELDLALKSVAATIKKLRSGPGSVVALSLEAEALKLEIEIQKEQKQAAQAARAEAELAKLGKTAPLFVDFWCDEPDKTRI
ncbi:MAG: tetratricopeptide repeat protein [Candidatus Melainabacteria bacterium]|nr:tetratricopeptide repeat protein [Candidatus Melainabacteria bacterium]